MNANIIVHSQSGHTARVAKDIRDVLRDRGNSADLMLLRPTGKIHPGSRDVSLRSMPETAPYDVLLFGGPVWGFRASPVVRKCLSELSSLKGKKTVCFVTMGFPFRALGGTRALRQMNNLLDLSGADILPGVVVPYTMPPSDEKVRGFSEEIVALLESSG